MSIVPKTIGQECSSDAHHILSSDRRLAGAKAIKVGSWEDCYN